MDVKKAISLLSLKRDVARKLQESWKDVEYCPPDGAVASAELFSCQYKDYADALDLAISVLELMPEVKKFDFRKVTKLAPMQEAGECHFRGIMKMELLSLGQLCELDEKPVWIEDKEYPINTGWVIWDGNFTEEWVNGEPREEYGKTWFAYSYLPVFSDVKVFCGSWVGEADGYADGELMYDVWRCGNCGHVEETDDPVLLPRFCPECGRAMTLEAWAELERRLSGENP